MCLQHTQHDTLKLSSCLRFLGGTLPVSECCTKTEQLDGVCSIGLQFMPLSAPKLHSCVGPYQVPSQVLRLHGQTALTVRPLVRSTEHRLFPCHSRSLGGAQSCTKGPWLTGDAGLGSTGSERDAKVTCLDGTHSVAL